VTMRRRIVIITAVVALAVATVVASSHAASAASRHSRMLLQRSRTKPDPAEDLDIISRLREQEEKEMDAELDTEDAEDSLSAATSRTTALGRGDAAESGEETFDDTTTAGLGRTNAAKQVLPAHAAAGSEAGDVSAAGSKAAGVRSRAMDDEDPDAVRLAAVTRPKRADADADALEGDETMGVSAAQTTAGGNSAGAEALGADVAAGVRAATDAAFPRAAETADGKAEPVTATAAAAERGAPIQKFKIYNEQWLDQSEDIAEDFVDTPAMARLKAGHFGEVDLKELGVDGAGAVKKGVHATLSRCLHTLNLFKSIKMFHDGVLPPREVLPSCAHRKFRLLFVLEKTSDYYKGRQIQSELASVNIRLFAFAAELAKRGHTALVADVDHLHQVEIEKLDAIIFVKVLEQGFQQLQNTSVPLIWDHVDEWDGFPFWDLGTWEHKETFTGVLTAGRVAKVAFDKAGIPAHVLYHNHANYASFHRPDRTAPVKVIALQGDYHSKDSDVFPMLEQYCEERKLTFRSGHYTGRGWEVDEFAASLAQGVPNHGAQLGWYMGFNSVDIAVLWPKGYTQFHICYKPTSRLAQFASLGIPLVTYPFASYIDILVEFGYPLVAETLEEASAMLDHLVASPQLRQEASEKLLEIAKFLSVEELTESYEQALCEFLSPEALELRKPVDTEAKR